MRQFYGVLLVLLCLSMVCSLGARKEEKHSDLSQPTEADIAPDTIGTDADASEVDPAVADEKLLTQVNYWDGATAGQYNLTYDENGLLVKCTSDHYTNTGNIHSEYIYTYNERGQLIRYQDTNNVHPDREYHYSDDGILTSWSFWDFDTYEYTVKCEYNEQGQLVQENGGIYSSKYSYDETGSLVSQTIWTQYSDMEQTHEHTYLYDDLGRLTEDICVTEYDIGSGPEKETSSLKYTYDYDPFVLVDSYYDGKYNGYSELKYKDISQIFIDVGDTAEYEMVDGYLSRVMWQNNAQRVYEFYYDGAVDPLFDEHIPAIKYEDEITGTYLAEYEDVKISIDAESSSEYYLTYTTSEETLADIPLAYFTINTPTEKGLMFTIDDPQYSGYVEICWSEGDPIGTYTYNSIIEGLEDTGGSYASLSKVGIYIPAT